MRFPCSVGSGVVGPADAALTAFDAADDVGILAILVQLLEHGLGERRSDGEHVSDAHVEDTDHLASSTLPTLEEVEDRRHGPSGPVDHRIDVPAGPGADCPAVRHR